MGGAPGLGGSGRPYISSGAAEGRWLVWLYSRRAHVHKDSGPSASARLDARG